MPLEQVPPKTPILDAADAQGGRVGLVAAIVRPLKALFDRIRQRRAQRYIDRTWHTPQGQAETQSTVYRSEPPPGGRR